MRLAGITVIISLITMPCAGMEISRVTGCAGGDVLKLRGEIVAGDYVKFRSYFDDQKRIAGLHLDSPRGLPRKKTQEIDPAEVPRDVEDRLKSA